MYLIERFSEALARMSSDFSIRECSGETEATGVGHLLQTSGAGGRLTVYGRWQEQGTCFASSANPISLLYK